MTIDPRQLGVLIATVAPLGLLACGGGPFGEFDDEICLYSSDALAGLAPAEGIDFVGLRSSYDYDPEQQVSTHATWGDACASATDPDACLSTLSALPMIESLTTRSGQITEYYDLGVTAGDDVFAVSDDARLLEVLGTVDSPTDAALVAFAAGHNLPCSENNVRQVGDGYELLGTVGTTCGGDISHYEIHVTPDGQVTFGEKKVVEEGDDNCAIGRRPDGLCTQTRKARTLGAFFANASHLEAASVPAFGQLAAELAAHGAPRALVRACLRARADEIRHTRATAALARRFGAEPIRPVVAPRRLRPLFDVALDNATEGCVRETFGAAVAHVQARRARRRPIRHVLGTIAVEETRHAALSWAIDGWIQGRLGSR
ncbi:MAG: ferritin-like domain-containing protein, partial [Polyangiaceae bacterium]